MGNKNFLVLRETYDETFNYYGCHTLLEAVNTLGELTGHKANIEEVNHAIFQYGEYCINKGIKLYAITYISKGKCKVCGVNRILDNFDIIVKDFQGVSEYDTVLYAVCPDCYKTYREDKWWLMPNGRIRRYKK